MSYYTIEHPAAEVYSLRLQKIKTGVYEVQYVNKYKGDIKSAVFHS